MAGKVAVMGIFTGAGVDKNSIRAGKAGSLISISGDIGMFDLYFKDQI
jgi:hypothetical protein